MCHENVKSRSHAGQRADWIDTLLPANFALCGEHDEIDPLIFRFVCNVANSLLANDTFSFAYENTSFMSTRCSGKPGGRNKPTGEVANIQELDNDYALVERS
jgi:hypothetical protein